MIEFHPLLNAILNATAGGFLFSGFLAIRRGDMATHRRRMIGALVASSLFLCSYLLRVATAGTHRFPVEGAWKTLYLAILLSHTVLAMALLPMVLRTVWLSLRGRFQEHRRIARITFPVWAYVSVTGVVVYLMLYHLPTFL